MSEASIVIIGAAVCASYFLASALIGPSRRNSRVDRSRDVIATVVLFTGYTVAAVVLCRNFPGPITMVLAIVLLAAVAGGYSYYRDTRDTGSGARPTGDRK
jgi:hypothetical protein